MSWKSPRLRSGEVLLSHNHIALLEGLAWLPGGLAPSYRAWIAASLPFITRYYFMASPSNLLRGCQSMSPEWVKRRWQGSSIQCLLTEGGRSIVEGVLPAQIRGQGLYQPRVEQRGSPADAALTAQEALRAYARMMNTLSVEPLMPLLADDFTYESQYVFSALRSKWEFMEYIWPKLRTIRKAGATVFAEMGMVFAYGVRQHCVVLAQDSPENLVGLVLAKVSDGKLSRLDLCIAPSPGSAARTGEYPA